MPKRKAVKPAQATTSRKSKAIRSTAKRTAKTRRTDSADGGGAGQVKWTATKTLNEIRRLYRANTNRAYAQSIKKYMRNQFEFYGLRTPLRRQLDAEVSAAVDFSEWTGARIHSLILLLWEQPERDYQHFALELGRKHVHKVLYDFDHAVTLFRKMIMNKSWWDTVDMISPHLVGALVRSEPERGAALMDAWIKDNYLWIRRAAILHQLAYKKDSDEERLFRYCLECCQETDFFIRKAIGWALRQHAYVRPSAVKGFVAANDEQLSPLSKKEALKHLGGWPMKS